ncbi:MAG: DegV family protein [Pelolinea sp.]|nr:DegV family protein [Pelolinea sp.]
MAYRIALVTDSTCDIPADWLKQYQISVVPMTLIFGDEQFLDGIQITALEFYERLLNSPIHPSTSQPTPEAFIAAFKKAAAAGAEEIIAMVISSAMSGTYSSAMQAAQQMEIPVHVHDSLNNSMGLGWQVMAAARAREKGGSVDAMLAAAQKVREHMVYYISLDTIEYLARGGRIGGAVKFLDSVLKVKPLIYVRPDTGTVAPGIPARSRAAALQGLYREFFRHIDTNQRMHITVLHNNAEDEACAIEEQIRKEYSPQELFVTIVTPALGAHTGPRAVALCGYSE